MSPERPNSSTNVGPDAGIGQGSPTNTRSLQRKGGIKLRVGVLSLAVLLVVLVCTGLWVVDRVNFIKTELESANALIPQLKEEVAAGASLKATETVVSLRSHTASARDAAGDPIFNLAFVVPVIGPNFSAMAEVARAADDVSTLGVAPLVSITGSVDWNSLLPSAEGTDFEPIQKATPSLVSAAHAVRATADRLRRIETGSLLPQIAEPLERARIQLESVSGAMDASADVSEVLPKMLGVDGQRSYLLMVQNNAESRASGGIPGALAILSLDHGKLSLGAQSSASAIGSVSPPLPVDPEQQDIFSTRLGKYMQDVNLTPDFPTAATTAQLIWESKTSQRVDGVISIDPIVLSYILKATGPIQIAGPELSAVKTAGLPAELSAGNVVQTLLSDVYARIEQPKLQDAYFAGMAREIFSVLANGKGESKGLVEGITRGVEEGRVLIWSDHGSEQSIITKYAISGAVVGPSVPPAQFGVYFNDGTGAKMDYYVKRTVQLVRECPSGGYEQTTVRITSTNNAPTDAATSLPEYVTGGGNFGVAPGTVQTNIMAYGPVQATIESASINGEKTPFAPYLHANRPVGVVAQQLAPGESKTVDFTFGKIVQHAEPNLVVTPTVQPVKDVILQPENASCR